uniref:TGBp1 n=1 Tax=Grapevine rupestris stem pitting-associated virus TaxID=196400 RepID=A0A0N9BEB0_9VIRU|nr:TGBp1 [Grapevine rupestris stem pitting-associated virus]
MNNLVKALSAFEFVGVFRVLKFPVVVHSVPGSGKSSLIRELISEDEAFVAFTAGVPDSPNLIGRYIKPYAPGCAVQGKINILDEYLSVSDTSGFDVLFSDPYQNVSIPREAHFIKTKTCRFGTNTCKYLQSFGFNVCSDGVDKVVVGSPFELEVEGVLICFGKEAVDLAVAHNSDFKLPCEVRGSTFDVVTLLKSRDPTSEDKHWFYVAATRHRSKLIIMQ